MLDGAHRQGVVADDSLIAAEHVCGSRAACGSDSRRLTQPSIQYLDAAVKVIETVRIDERFYGAECAGTQCAGIGLCPRA